MNGLPLGWSAVTLGDLGEWSSGGTPSRKVAANFGGNIPWVKTGDLRHQIIDKIEETITEVGLANSAAKVFPKGTLLVAMYGATIGQSGVLPVAAATNQACAALIANGATTELIPYVWRYIISIQEELKAIGQGGAQPNISQTILKDVPIKIAPLPEQARIVTKIESLSAKSKRSRGHLDHIPRLVEKYKRAILAAAYADAQRQSQQTIPLGEIAAEVRNGLSKKPADNPPGSPILRISSVRPLTVRLDDVRYYPTIEEVPDTALLRDEDLLFTRYNGNPDFTAVCGMVRGLTKATTYPDKLIRVRLTDKANPRFVEIICSAAQSREWLAPHIKSAAGQHGISGGDLKQLPIPLPLLAEQNRIAQRVAIAFGWIDRLTSEATTARTLIKRLDQAILAKAFQGALVPQDPSDEPASALLERIRADRAATEKPARRRSARG